MNEITEPVYCKDLVSAWARNEIIIERDIFTGDCSIYTHSDKSPNVSDMSKEWYTVTPGEEIYISPFLRTDCDGSDKTVIGTFIGPLSLKSRIHQSSTFIRWIGAYNKAPEEVLTLPKKENELKPFVLAWAKGERVEVLSTHSNTWTPLSPDSEYMTFSNKYKYRIVK